MITNSLTLSQGQMLGGLALAVVSRLGHDSVLINPDDRSQKILRLARIGNVVLADQPADEIGPRAINGYIIERQIGKAFRIDPPSMLFSLQWPSDGSPEFDLKLVRDPAEWFDRITETLRAALDLQEQPAAVARPQ